MIVSVADRRRPFAPSPHTPEKRDVRYTLRLSESEKAILERLAAKRGVTAINLMRIILAEALLRQRNSSR